MKRKVVRRKRIFIAVEGEGEQSFVKWLQDLCNQHQLPIHLDTRVLGGGGYKHMLEKALRLQKRDKDSKTKAKTSILLVDGDREQHKDDGWTLVELKHQATKNSFELCIQHPNQEGVFLRMHPGQENKQPDLSTVKDELIKLWPQYVKPVDANTLKAKFCLKDLYRLVDLDSELKKLLQIIGLIKM